MARSCPLILIRNLVFLGGSGRKRRKPAETSHENPAGPGLGTDRKADSGKERRTGTELSANLEAETRFLHAKTNIRNENS